MFIASVVEGCEWSGVNSLLLDVNIQQDWKVNRK